MKTSARVTARVTALVAALVLSLAPAACTSVTDDPAQTPPDSALRTDGAAGDLQLHPGDGSISSDAALVPLAGPHAQVTVAVANIRNKQVPATPGSYAIDMDQETQVLYGDLLQVVKEQGSWLQVTVPKQLFYDEAKQVYVPYPGWIQATQVARISSWAPHDLTVTAQTAKLYAAADKAKLLATLSVGTRLAGAGAQGAAGLRVVHLPGGGRGWIAATEIAADAPGAPSVSRAQVLARAARFLGATYLWGGYSAPRGAAYPASSTGVDCSGLSGLTYRSLGVSLPRNADDQYRRTTALSKLTDLARGDLIFLSKDGTAGGIRHVMLYDGNERYIESTNAGAAVVRWATFSSTLGLTLAQLEGRGGKVSAQSYVLASRVGGVSWVK